MHMPTQSANPTRIQRTCLDGTSLLSPGIAALGGPDTGAAATHARSSHQPRGEVRHASIAPSSILCNIVSTEQPAIRAATLTLTVSRSRGGLARRAPSCPPPGGVCVIFAKVLPSSERPA